MQLQPSRVGHESVRNPAHNELTPLVTFLEFPLIQGLNRSRV